MVSLLLFVCTAFASTNALTCVTDGNIATFEYYQGVIVSSSSNDFTYGFNVCSANLNRCANFKSMNVTDFVNLDVGKDNSDFAQMIRKSEGTTVVGRCCMSQADVDKIGATQADKCDANAKSCFCTTDQCTGAAGAAFSLISLLALFSCSAFL